MKSALIFPAAFFAGANACGAAYASCHCTNSDGTANDTITATVCNFSNRDAPKSPGWPVYTEERGGVLKCIANTQAVNYDVPLDNCKFRESCTANGATGADSSCDST
ncbi:hypothetical protein LZ32DRAFT_666008 [Colletotrichum eremochloae]|nr:hypothetical protein LZ32DRAFT_666008 [Colletotrichum eremochloae]